MGGQVYSLRRAKVLLVFGQTSVQKFLTKRTEYPAAREVVGLAAENLVELLALVVIAVEYVQER